MSDELPEEIIQWIVGCVDTIAGKVVDNCSLFIYGTCSSDGSANHSVIVCMFDQQGSIIDREFYKPPVLIDLAQLSTATERIIDAVRERTGIAVNASSVAATQSPQEPTSE